VYRETLGNGFVPADHRYPSDRPEKENQVTLDRLYKIVFVLNLIAIVLNIVVLFGRLK
jgi:hypothetical protein